LIHSSNHLEICAEKIHPEIPAFGLSCITKTGVTEFLDYLVSNISSRFSIGVGESIGVTHSRHRVLLGHCVDYLDSFLGLQSLSIFLYSLFLRFTRFFFFNTENAREENIVLAGEDLRHAAGSLGEITGKVGVEELLDVIFKDFCIGK